MAGLTAALAVVLVPCRAAASLAPPSDDALARASAAAVIGRVAAIASAWDPETEAIYTYVTLEVRRSWGLPGAPAEVVLKQLGGRVGDSALIVGGQARFAAGEEVLAFLDVRPRDHTLSVAGLERGKWTLAGGAAAASVPATATAVRDIRGHAGAALAGRQVRPLDELIALAGQAGTRVSAAHAVLVPRERPAPSPNDYAPAFTFLGDSTPSRWHEADADRDVYVDTQHGGHPRFVDGGLPQLTAASLLWSSSPAAITLRPGASRGPRCFANSEPADGRISVTYDDPCDEIADDSMTLAIGGAYFSPVETRSVSGIAFWKITKAMIVTDDNPAKFAEMSAGCYEDVIAHELGHAVGLGHSAIEGALMFPTLAMDCWRRTESMPLHPDDIAGITTIYPSSAVTAPPRTPAALDASVVGSQVTIRWQAPDGGPAPIGYQLRAGTGPGLTDVGTLITAGHTLVVPNVPDGVYHLRVVAGNRFGISAPTPDRAIRVGPPPPGAPTALTGQTAPGGHVALSWTPPTDGGPAQSYRVLVGVTSGATSYTFPAAGTSLRAAGAPPGTYYVRVVAVNRAGASPPSNEAVITVR